MSISSVSSTPNYITTPQSDNQRAASSKSAGAPEEKNQPVATRPKHVMSMEEKLNALANLKPVRMPYNPELMERTLKGLENFDKSRETEKTSATRSLEKYQNDYAIQTQRLEEQGSSATPELKQLVAETASAVKHYQDRLIAMKAFTEQNEAVRASMFKFASMLSENSVSEIKEIYRERIDKSV